MKKPTSKVTVKFRLFGAGITEAIRDLQIATLRAGGFVYYSEYNFKPATHELIVEKDFQWPSEWSQEQRDEAGRDISGRFKSVHYLVEFHKSVKRHEAIRSH